jgi:hypothetical protein
MDAGSVTKAPRTPPFHGGDPGSSPVGDAKTAQNFVASWPAAGSIPSARFCALDRKVLEGETQTGANSELSQALTLARQGTQFREILAPPPT